MDPRERARTVSLLAWLEEGRESDCPTCRREVGPHERVMSHALGYKDEPRCAGCLAEETGRERVPFLEHLLDYLQNRPCYRTGWEWASQRSGSAGILRPPHLWEGR